MVLSSHLRLVGLDGRHACPDGCPGVLGCPARAQLALRHAQHARQGLCRLDGCLINCRDLPWPRLGVLRSDIHLQTAPHSSQCPIINSMILLSEDSSNIVSHLVCCVVLTQLYFTLDSASLS